MKLCTKCKISKDLSSYGKQPGGRNGLKSQCNSCITKRIKERYHLDQAFREYRKEKAKGYKVKYPERYVEGYKKYAQKTSEKRKAYLLKLHYNITPEQKQIMLEKQQFKCLGCGLNKKLVVDHDHKTGKVRGLLCSSCNTSLGLLKENRDYILGLLNYLDNFSKESI